MNKFFIDGEVDWHPMSKLELLGHDPAYAYLKDFMRGN